MTIHRVDFTQPLRLLMDCHRRIERFFGQLEAVVACRWSGDLSLVDRQTLATALDYFDQAARRHTEDEEQSLFPRLRRREVLVELDKLEADHRQTAIQHRRLGVLGRRWLANGKITSTDYVDLCAVLKALKTAYTDHIQCEDECIFALAARVLTPAELNEIGTEMAQRRAADPGPSCSTCAQRRRRTLSALSSGVK